MTVHRTAQTHGPAPKRTRKAKTPARPPPSGGFRPFRGFRDRGGLAMRSWCRLSSFALSSCHPTNSAPLHGETPTDCPKKQRTADAGTNQKKCSERSLHYVHSILRPRPRTPRHCRIPPLFAISDRPHKFTSIEVSTCRPRPSPQTAVKIDPDCCASEHVL